MKHTCPNCKKEFEGRSNQKFCTIACKNESYYAKVAEMHKHNRHGLANMSSNERILVKYVEFKKIGYLGKIMKSDLTAYGFKEHGPFWVQEQKLRIGKYLLKDCGNYYELHNAYAGLGFLSGK